MSEELDQGAVETTGPVGGASEPTPELTVQDLGNLRAIIDVAAQRGAFRAPEMEAVGAAFNKLNNFLNAVAPQQTAEEAANAAA